MEIPLNRIASHLNVTLTPPGNATQLDPQNMVPNDSDPFSFFNASYLNDSFYTNLSSGVSEPTTGVDSTATVKQSVHVVVIMSTIYGIVFLLALVGNLSVVAVVAKDRSLHTATNFFLVNMAVADMLMAIFCLPITLLSNIFNGWLFGAFMCKAVPYLQGVSVCASVNTLVVIAVDRYVAICHVMRQRNTKRMARFILLVIWILSLLLLTPWALFYEHSYFPQGNETFAICQEKFPTETLKKGYFLGVIFLMCYTLPLTLIAACYFKIGYRVWHRDAPGITSSKGVIEKSKVRVVKMLAVVVLLFMISWMPLYIIRLKLDFFPPDGNTLNTIHKLIIPFAQWLGTSNSCMNPLVYCLFSQKIRRRIRAMLCCSKPETRSLYSTRSMYNSALHHSTSTRESSLRLDSCTNGHSSAGHYHHYRPTRQDSELIRMHRSHIRSTHV